jgi:predicted MPP superfamily phosphohydrolase
MNQFIAVVAFFLCIYGLFHLYLLIKARRAFYLQGLNYLFLFFILVVLLIAPIHSRILEAQGYVILSLIMAWIGYIWMGMLFVFVCLSLPMDCYNMFMVFLQRLSNAELTHLMLSRRQRFVLPAILSFIVLGYGLYEAQHIRLETVTLHSAKIPPQVNRLRIVQISDVHIGPMLFSNKLTAILKAVQSAQPDLLVSTGDLVDGRIQNEQTIIQAFQAIAPPMGKFAVTGNHEFYSDYKYAIDFTQKGGFTLLQNKSIAIRDFLSLTGVDDPAGGELEADTEKKLLMAISPEKFTVLLKHRPVIAQSGSRQFNLQLSGHTHRGQMFPFNILIHLLYPLDNGLQRISAGSWLYTSRGAGTWGPPFRLLAPPEVTVIDLLPESKS